MNDKITIIIPNYNGRSVLPHCLGSIVVQRAVPDDIIVVDNNSTDDSVEVIRQEYPAVNLVVMRANSGFGAVMRMGVRAAKHTNIVLMNNHVVAPHGWLEHVREQFDKLPSFGRNQRRYLFYSGIGQGPVPFQYGEEIADDGNPDIMRLKSELQRRNSELRDSRRRIAKLEASVSAQKKRVKDINDLTYQKSIAEGKLLNLEQQFAETRSRLEKRESENAVLKESIRKRTAEKAELENRLLERESELEEAGKRIKNLNGVVAELQSGSDRTAAKLKTRLDAANDMIETLKAHAAELEAYYEPRLREKDAELQKTLDNVAELIGGLNRTKAGKERQTTQASHDAPEGDAGRAPVRPPGSDVDYEAMLAEKDAAIENAMALVAELVENISELNIKLKTLEGRQ